MHFDIIRMRGSTVLQTKVLYATITSSRLADRAVWEKITKGRAGIRCGNVVKKVWKDLGGDQEEVLSIEKFGGYKTEAK